MQLLNFQTYEIGTVRPLSVKFSSETVKDRGNPPTYCRKFSEKFIQQQQQKPH